MLEFLTDEKKKIVDTFFVIITKTTTTTTLDANCLSLSNYVWWWSYNHKHLEEEILNEINVFAVCELVLPTLTF